MNEDAVRVLAPQVLGIFVRRGNDFAAAEDAEHPRRQDADDVLVHSAAAGASLITGRTSIHSYTGCPPLPGADER